MGIREWLGLSKEADIEPMRCLDVPSGFNVRELGGYAVGAGSTRWRRFVRAGALDTLTDTDQRRLSDYGVRLVVDLRGEREAGYAPDRLGRMRGLRYLHVPLYDFDLSDPALEHDDHAGDYLSLGYLTMLANRAAVREIFSFFATAAKDECVLFHCAVGMDRTGVTAMLLLGLVGASTDRIVADYCYSFGSVREVDAHVFRGKDRPRQELELRMGSMRGVFGRLLEAYGTVEAYLGACGVTAQEIEAVRQHLVG